MWGLALYEVWRLGHVVCNIGGVRLTFVTVAIAVMFGTVCIIDGVALLKGRHTVKTIKQALLAVTRLITLVVPEEVIAVNALSDGRTVRPWVGV